LSWGVVGQSFVNFLAKYKIILANFSYLSIIQIFNLALPLITYPFLIRTLGHEVYGKVVFSQAIIGYFVIFVNFGFNISATKEISINRSNPRIVNRIVSSVYQIKGVLLLISFVLLGAYLLFFGKDGDRSLYLLTMWMCVYEFLFPVWYFQGIEKMKHISILTILSRLIFLVLIYLLIASPSDYLLVPIINGVGALVSCLFAIRILIKNGVRFKVQSLASLNYYVKLSYVMAISVGINSFKTNFNIVVVKYFFSYSAVAYYDLALKVVNIGITFLDMISQAIYPKMSKSKDSRFLRNIALVSVGFACVMTIVCQIFSSWIVTILGGAQMQNATLLLRVLAFIFPIYIVGALYGRNCLIVHGYNGEVLKSMFFSGLIYIFLIIVMRYAFPTIDTMFVAVAYIGSFLFESLYRYIRCQNLKLI